MLYNLVKTYRGKQEVVMTDERSKVQDRMKSLRKSQAKGIKGFKVVYSIEETEEVEKFKKKPHNPRIGGGDARTPRRVKWDKK